MERHKIQVSYRLSGMRLDHAIADAIPGMSKRRAKAIIDVGGAYLNRKRIRVASRTVGKGDQIEVEYNPALFGSQQMEKSRLALGEGDILFENSDLFVINKPASIPSQATRDQAILHIVPLLKKLLLELGKPVPELELVHRLDKDTTGCLLIAKNKATMHFLTEQFRDKTLSKTYHALCYGIAPAQFEESCFLSAIQAHSGRVKVMKSGGKFSQTRFELLESFPKLGLSLLQCSPITGRSHQIRVHLEKNGFPIVGDKVYGEGLKKVLPDALQGQVSHQLLHAASITFSLPQGPVTVDAPYPETFAGILSTARST